MKILVISYADDINGAEGSLRLATKYWNKNLGWEIEVLHPRGGEFKDLTLIANAGMTPISALILGTHYDFVIVNLFHNLEWIHRISNVPIIFWVHEGLSAFSSSNLTISHLTQTFTKSQSVIFSSKYQSEILFKSFLRDSKDCHIHIVPYAIESLGLKLGKERENSTDHFYISWVGSVISRKRPLDLVRATSSLTLSKPLQVDFIGPLFNSWSLGEEFLEILHLENSIFQWHDALSHLQTLELVATSDVFCFTSEDESTGLAPLEAASLHVPVIMAELPIYEFIGWKNEVNCLMYPLGDIEQLKVCIERIAGDSFLRETLIFNGAKLAKKFTPQKFLSAITRAVTSF